MDLNEISILEVMLKIFILKKESNSIRFIIFSKFIEDHNDLLDGKYRFILFISFVLIKLITVFEFLNLTFTLFKY